MELLGQRACASVTLLRVTLPPTEVTPMWVLPGAKQRLLPHKPANTRGTTFLVFADVMSESTWKLPFVCALENVFMMALICVSLSLDFEFAIDWFFSFFLGITLH